MYKVALIYDSGRRYVIPFEIVEKALELDEKQIKKVKVAVLKEIQKIA